MTDSKSKAKRLDHQQGPGASPFIQGYWANSENEPRVVPDWHERQKDPYWIAEWLRGWDEKEIHKRGSP